MNYKFDPTCNPHADGEAPRLAPVLFKLLWIIPGAALLCLAIFLSLGRTRLSESGAELVVTFVYSTLIGLPSALSLNYIAHRYSARIPRLIFLVDTLLLLATATAGTLVGDLLLQIAGVVPHGDYWPE